MLFVQYPICVFQNLIHRSAVPPPEARRLFWKGDHARAFTAAWWPSNLNKGIVASLDEVVAATSHMFNRLSLPPLASCWPECDHLRPQTSWLCPSKVEVGSLTRTANTFSHNSNINTIVIIVIKRDKNCTTFSVHCIAVPPLTRIPLYVYVDRWLLELGTLEALYDENHTCSIYWRLNKRKIDEP